MKVHHYVYTPLEHTLTLVLWGVFAVTAIALIVVWTYKSKRIKKLEAQIRKLETRLTDKSSRLAVYESMQSAKSTADFYYDDDFLSEFVEPEPAPAHTPEPTPESEQKPQKQRLRDKLSVAALWTFMGSSIVLRLIIDLALFVAPVVVLDLPWWGNLLIFASIFCIPTFGVIVHFGIYIWALVVVIQSGDFNVLIFLFYVSLVVFVAILVLPFIAALIESRGYRPHKKINWKHVLLCVFIVGLVAVFAAGVIPALISSAEHKRQEAEAGFTWSFATPDPTRTPEPTLTPIPQTHDLKEAAFPARNMASGVAGLGDCGMLTVTASPAYNYTFLSVVRTRDTEPCINVYIRGGATLEVEVPYGMYKIYCAEGDNYYGYTNLFGPEGVYSELDGYFNFYEDDEYVYGHTLTLTSSYYGNLNSSSLTLADFPH